MYLLFSYLHILNVNTKKKKNRNLYLCDEKKFVHLLKVSTYTILNVYKEDEQYTIESITRTYLAMKQSSRNKLHEGKHENRQDATLINRKETRNNDST